MVLAIASIDFYPIFGRCLTSNRFYWRRNKPRRFSHGYVEHVAAAIALAVTDDRAAGRIYNLGEASTPTLLERIQTLGNLVDWHGEIVTLPGDQLPSHLQMNLQWQYHLATDTTRFREELGYVEPMTKEEALRQTIDWEQENLTATRPE
jgi:nucleoside-diphosphate-sugar epimerase